MKISIRKQRLEYQIQSSGTMEFGHNQNTTARIRKKRAAVLSCAIFNPRNEPGGHPIYR